MLLEDAAVVFDVKKAPDRSEVFLEVALLLAAFATFALDFDFFTPVVPPPPDAI